MNFASFLFSFKHGVWGVLKVLILTSVKQFKFMRQLLVLISCNLFAESLYAEYREVIGNVSVGVV